MSGPLLHVRGLEVSVGDVPILRGIDLDLERGGSLALVGESGAGKTTALLAILQLLPDGFRVRLAQGERGPAGALSFDGRDLTRLSPSAVAAIRGREIGAVFQEPASSLNPLMRVGEQVAEVLRHHRSLGRRAAAGRAVELFGEMGIEDPARCARAYPHELSGGMNQRVAIAMATACEPALVVADEPTASLDVTVQRDVLALFDRLRREHGTALLLVTHDLAVAANSCERAAVMRAGRIVEEGPVRDLLLRPSNDYTRELVGALPQYAPPLADEAAS